MKSDNLLQKPCTILIFILDDYDAPIQVEPTGNAIKTKNLPLKSKKASLSLEGLKSDVYYLIVRDGELSHEEKIIKL